VTDFRLNRAELARLERSAPVAAAVRGLGEAIAADARARAPRAAHSGGGAQSIRAESIVGQDGYPETHVSWDTEHFYMSFVEFGTSRMHARPFLRPAAEKYS
jgi:HK97 gp10 family phage protein